MGYCIYIISKDKEISEEDFDTAFNKLSVHNRTGLAGTCVCDVFAHLNYIRISGSFGISGEYAEGFTLNLLLNLLDLGYLPKVISRDWEYGTDEDWKWLDKIMDIQPSGTESSYSKNDAIHPGVVEQFKDVKSNDRLVRGHDIESDSHIS